MVLQQLTGAGWLRSIQWVDEIDSTNRLARDLAERPDVLTPLLVVSPNQIAGRGRRGKAWYSDAGTLTFSVLLSGDDLADSRERWSQLALAAGVALRDVVHELVVPADVRVKWPNDVYVDGGKVAGILIESAGRASDKVVVGIGLNVATDLSAADATIRPNARSLRDYLDKPMPTLDILPAIIERLRFRIDQWSSDSSEMLADFSSHCFLTGRDVVIDQNGHAVAGRCVGINSNGQLLVKKGSDSIEVRSGEVVSWS